MDDMKKCFKCNKLKDLVSFYRHKKMKDGHLGKCKSCTKKDVIERYYDPIFRKKIKLYEKLRFKNPERKKKVLEYQRNRRLRTPNKVKARQKIGNLIRDGKIKRLPCQICGSNKSQAHHEDYRKPLLITWLCFKHHREIHQQLID